MTLILPTTPESHEWIEHLGVSREEIIHTILEGDWFRLKSPTSFVEVDQITDGPQFGLGFNCFSSHESREWMINKTGKSLYNDKQRVQGPVDDSSLRFDIIFRYYGNPQSMRLRSVFFRGNKQSKEKGIGTGEALLVRLQDAASITKSNSICVVPGLEGNYYWTARGAIIEDDRIFETNLSARIDDILTGQHPTSWTKDDYSKLKDIQQKRSLLSLQRMAARDDLRVGKVKLRMYLFEGLSLGTCKIDLNNEWTQDCLKTMRANCAARKNFACPARPRQSRYATFNVADATHHS